MNTEGVTLDINFPPEFESLFTQVKEMEQYVTQFARILNTKTEYVFCPVCSNGYLYPVIAGKIAGVINDKWLICNNCNAKFDKQLNRARIVEVTMDPYETFASYGNKSLSLKKWNDIGLSRIRDLKRQYENSINEIKTTISNNIAQQIAEGKVKLLLTDIRYFILKPDEEPVFATRAVIYEEKKRRITRRLSTDGGRRTYGGVSIRLAKGLYYHIGESAPATPRESISESTTYSETVPAENGDFLVTNQRIIFKGEQSKGATIPLDKVSAIDPDYDENRIMIIQESKKPEVFKLFTEFIYHTDYTDIPIKLDLDTVVNLIKLKMSNY